MLPFGVSNPMVFDPTHFKRLFTAGYSPVEGDRLASANAQYNYFVKSGAHPDEINFSVGNDLIARNQTVIARLEAEIATLNNENQYLRRHVGERILRDAASAGKVAFRWFEFEDLLRSRYADDKGDLPRHWRNLLGSYIGATSRDIGRWEQGVAPIPDDVFEAVRRLPARSDAKPARKKAAPSSHGRRASGQGIYSWPEAVTRIGVDLWLSGANRNTMREAMQEAEPNHEIKPNMVTGKFDTSPPPEFLDVVVRPMGEAIDWLELWLIGATIYASKNTWRLKSLSALGLNPHFLPPNDLNFGTKQAKIDALRKMYIEHNLSRLKVKPGSEMFPEVSAIFVKAGPGGATQSDVRKIGKPSDYRRISELQKALRLFDTGRLRGKETIYAASDFAEHHPDAWKIALKHYGPSQGAD
jgi:hypothetical protein